VLRGANQQDVLAKILKEDSSELGQSVKRTFAVGTEAIATTGCSQTQQRRNRVTRLAGSHEVSGSIPICTTLRKIIVSDYARTNGKRVFPDRKTRGLYLFWLFAL